MGFRVGCINDRFGMMSGERQKVLEMKRRDANKFSVTVAPSDVADSRWLIAGGHRASELSYAIFVGVRTAEP